MRCAFLQSLPQLGSPSSKRAGRSRQTCPQCVVILGGTSGVGLEVASFLRSRSVPVSIFSRRTGHDFLNIDHAKAAFSMPDDKFVVSVGAGRRNSSLQEERRLYSNITSAARAAGPTSLILFVVRSMIVYDIVQMLSDLNNSAWVLVRPGALVDNDSPHAANEKLIVTADMRCNGLVSRKAVARVIADVMLDLVSIDQIDRKCLGVYDCERMINNPADAPLIAPDLWN